jgi:hypothetical protein
MWPARATVGRQSSRCVYVIEFFSRKIRQPDQDLLNMLATIGSQIGQFIERKRVMLVTELRLRCGACARPRIR